MFASTFFVLALAAFAPSALATVYTTAPIGTTSWPAGQQATISWKDDGTTPSLQSFGPSKVSIYVGNAQQQTMLQSITNSVDVSTTSSIVFTPDGTVGPNGADYFIRFESLSLKDATSPQYPALAFSAKFALTGMSGTFNSSVQAEINGQSTAPLAGQTTAATSGSSATKSSTPLTTSKAGSSTSAASAAKSTTSSNAASQQVAVTGMAGLAAVAAAVFGLVF